MTVVKGRVSAVFARPFRIPGFDGQLPPGEYVLDAGHRGPRRPLRSGVEGLGAGPSAAAGAGSGLARSLTVPIADLEGALAEDSRSGAPPAASRSTSCWPTRWSACSWPATGSPTTKSAASAPALRRRRLSRRPAASRLRGEVRLEQRQAVLPPEHLLADDIARRAEHAAAQRLVGVALEASRPRSSGRGRRGRDRSRPRRGRRAPPRPRRCRAPRPRPRAGSRAPARRGRRRPRPARR